MLNQGAESVASMMPAWYEKLIDYPQQQGLSSMYYEIKSTCSQLILASIFQTKMS